MPDVPRLPAGHPSGHGGRFAPGDVDYTDERVIRCMQNWEWANTLPAADGTINVSDEEG
jgi:hypothetical protein